MWLGLTIYRRGKWRVLTKRHLARMRPANALCVAVVAAAVWIATMMTFLVIVHVFVCLFLILTVLLQPGNRGGAGGAFGGGVSTSFAGGRGANTLLAKITAGAAIVFMLTSITLSYAGGSGKSVMDDVATDTPAPTPTPAPAANGDAAPAPTGAAPAEGAAPAPAPANP